MPWDELADAYEALRAADRAGDAAAATAAAEWVEDCRRRCGLLGALLLSLAVEHGGFDLQKQLGRSFGELAAGAWDRATKAGKRATWAVDEIAYLKERVARLERQAAAAEGHRLRVA